MIDLGYVQPEAVPNAAQKPVRVRKRHMDADGCRFTLKILEISSSDFGCIYSDAIDHNANAATQK